MSPRTRLLSLALASALLLAAGLVWQIKTDAPVPAEAVAANAPRPVTQPVVPPATLPADLPPLPPADARPVSSVGPLKTRADQGDGVASCRLAVMLMRCQIAARKDFDAPDCAALPPGLADRAQHYLRSAALAGEPSARFLYASGAGFEATNDFRYLRTPEFDQWRREAGPLMQQSFADGDPMAVLVLAFAHSHDLGAFAGLVENNALQVIAHRRLAERIFGESLSALPIRMPMPRQPLTPEEDARADALASEWHLQHFQGRQHDMVALMKSGARAPWSTDAGPEATQDACRAPGAKRHD